MDSLSAISRRVSRWGLWFGGALVLLAAIVIGIDVLMRKFLLLDRAHIRIDSLYVHFAPALRIALDLAGLALFLAFFGLVAWHGIGVAEQSWTAASRSQSALETPTVIPQVLWLAGLAVFLASGILLLVQALATAIGGRLGDAVRLVGTRSAEEEVEEEIRDIRERAAREAGR